MLDWFDYSANARIENKKSNTATCALRVGYDLWADINCKKDTFQQFSQRCTTHYEKTNIQMKPKNNKQISPDEQYNFKYDYIHNDLFCNVQHWKDHPNAKRINYDRQ